MSVIAPVIVAVHVNGTANVGVAEAVDDRLVPSKRRRSTAVQAGP